ncbi:MAG: CBS domain-containing protein [Gammaproteobacteria bacterium]|nr:CBS domain-containing protein [Gammaproteobacteria bacterium]
MNRYPVVVEPTTTLPDAHYLMRKHGVRRLPVVAQGKLVGIVTLTDVLHAEPSEAAALKAWERDYLLGKTQVRQIMAVPARTVPAQATMAAAARLMLEHKIGGLPVVDADGTLVGILTESDVFRAFAGEWNEDEPPG